MSAVLLRLFIGVDLPPRIKNELSKVQQELMRFIPNAKWVKKNNLHLTLKFLGYCSPESVAEIDQEIKKISQKFSAFRFNLRDLGSFPSLKRARVIWIGIEKGKEEFTMLQSKIENALISLGFEEEKRDFHPHITLARLKIPRKLNPKQLNQVASLVPAEDIKANSITLFESKLTPKGAEYIKLTENSLKTN